MRRFLCLQLFFDVSLQFLTSLIMGHCSKLNWPKRVSTVYWVFGTLFYPCSFVVQKLAPVMNCIESCLNENDDVGYSLVAIGVARVL